MRNRGYQAIRCNYENHKVIYEQPKASWIDFMAVRSALGAGEVAGLFIAIVGAVMLTVLVFMLAGGWAKLAALVPLAFALVGGIYERRIWLRAGTVVFSATKKSTGTISDIYDLIMDFDNVTASLDSPIRENIAPMYPLIHDEGYRLAHSLQEFWRIAEHDKSGKHAALIERAEKEIHAKIAQMKDIVYSIHDIVFKLELATALGPQYSLLDHVQIQVDSVAEAIKELSHFEGATN